MQIFHGALDGAPMGMSVKVHNGTMSSSKRTRYRQNDNRGNVFGKWRAV